MDGAFLHKINMASTTSATQRVRHAYRSLARLVERLPDSKKQTAVRDEMRTGFRAPLGADETLDSRLKTAGEKIAFLRIITPAGTNQSSGGGGRWVYKNGKRMEDGDTKTRDGGGKVHSNWDGKNMDPCSVKRHTQQLKRAGFANNLHAKGIF